MNKIKKNINKILIIGVILLIIFLSVMIGINTKNNKKNIELLQNYIESDCYSECYTLIKDNKMLDDENTKSKVKSIVLSKINNYKVSTVSDVLNISNEDWLIILDYSKLIQNLNIEIPDDYYNIYNLEYIYNNDYIYFEVLRWYLSDDYDEYNSINSFDYIDNDILLEKADQLEKYSFEKYDINSEIIFDLNKEKNNYAEYLRKWANSSSSTLFEYYKSKVLEQIDIEEKLILNIETQKNNLENHINGNI